MAEALTVPHLPRALSRALRGSDAGAAGYAGARHPALAQGILFGQWSGTHGQQTTTKQREADKQVENFAAYLQQERERLKAVVAQQAAMSAEIGAVEAVRLRLVTRLSIGFGLANPLETGLLLHPLYGLPYLPGGAIKGVTQGALLLDCAAGAGVPRLTPRQMERWQTELRCPRPLALLEAVLLAAGCTDQARRALQALRQALDDWGALTDETAERCQQRQQRFADWSGAAHGHRKLAGWAHLYTILFGHPGQQGQVIFLDAFPNPQTLKLCVDVLTPHYQPYYQADTPGSVAPGDYYDPVPVPFLAVEAGARFTVRAIVRRSVDARFAGLVQPFIERALCRRGIGAKTSGGYGLFTPDKAAEPQG